MPPDAPHPNPLPQGEGTDRVDLKIRWLTLDEETVEFAEINSLLPAKYRQTAPSPCGVVGASLLILPIYFQQNTGYQLPLPVGVYRPGTW